MNSLSTFLSKPFIEALKDFFDELNVKMNYITDLPTSAQEILEYTYKENATFQLIEEVYNVGIIDEASFHGQSSIQLDTIKTDYDGILVFGVKLKERPNGLLPTRSQLAEISRAFNREFYFTPIVVVFLYDNHLAFAHTERLPYKQEWREGEKAGKVTMLKGIDLLNTHAAHKKILSGLVIDKKKIDSFKLLYEYWQTVFSLQALNNQFYADLQAWFYFATQNVKLPYKPDYVTEKENIKNFLVRLLARTMFCWFVKEKGLIQQELLELTDWEGNKFKLTHDIEDEGFLQSNSYYRGILQNVFFNALNQKEKKKGKDFNWTKYWHSDFNLEWLTQIPYLNGGIFDKLPEDNAKESIEDGIIQIPNFLFYGIEVEEAVSKGSGKNKRTEIQKVEYKGLNGILKSYKFTLDENTPFEEDIALDPEMLGLVFENLLAELDPNLEESTIKSIRKQTGSYYTPRKIIFEMVNDSLILYLTKFISENYPTIEKAKAKVNDLVYYSVLKEHDPLFEQAVVNALDKYKVLDPACGSGAFPMGMLHRIVDILKMVDPTNDTWISLKLQNVDKAQQPDFKKVLTSHLDDYGRKLGIIRDSIYGIDIQPLAVQITKLRFFISLLIDQKTERGITPMPNIETKIICADSLKNIETDFFSNDAIARLSDARTRYYQPDVSQEERKSIADEIIDVLDKVFPTFSLLVTGKRIPGQNKELIRDWFTHGNIAAPFFNMEFFYPELAETGGFDCVIGNPPYGGMKISDDVRQTLDIESKDPYGAFIARFLNAPYRATPLKSGGVLAYIVSDTFMTIKSHLKLRKHLVENYVHKMIRVHPDTFNATVNTVVMIAERNTQKELDENHICLMADLTNISIHDQYDHFVEVLNLTKGVDFEKARTHISNSEYAVYFYPQALIKTNSNLPFFVASPKLFSLMNDSGKDLKKEVKPVGGKNVQIRKIPINGKEVEVIKLGDIADDAAGVMGAKEYFGSLEGIQGTVVISSNNIIKRELSDYEKANGIKDEICCYIKFDKGGETVILDSFLASYYNESNFYINWSEPVVKILKDRNALRNQHRYFTFGIGYSSAGIYSPVFRLYNFNVFEKGLHGLFFNSDLKIEVILGILNSKIVRFCLKNYSNHSINTNSEDLSNLLIIPYLDLALIVERIITKIKVLPTYDYASHEQIEIDKLVYEAYGLNAEDVQEVEDWYARRYPKLSAAQKANLRALGKSDDYLELYGLK